MAKFEIKRPERRVEICLDGSLVAEYEAVQAELEDARKAQARDRRMNSPVAGLEKRQAELYKAQAEQTMVVTVRALQRNEWAQIKDSCAPRKGHQIDENFGFNVDEATQLALIADGGIAKVEQAGEPVEFTVDDWKALSPDLSDGQWEEIKTAVISANGGRPRVPFSQAGFKMTKDSDES